MNATELFQAGRLNDALAAAIEAVKSKPADASARYLLCEMLCFTGDLERADKHLDALAQIDAQLAIPAALFRQLIRGEQARQEFYQSGRITEAPWQADPGMMLRVKSLVLLRDHDVAGARELLDESDRQVVPVKGTCNGEEFEEFRDLDDLTAPFLEAFNVAGSYLWLAFDQISRVEFRPPQRPRDLLWRSVRMWLQDGSEAEAFLPVLYPGSARESDDALRLGRATDWRGEGDAPVRGVGQRMFLAGDTERTILELQELTFHPPTGA